MRIVLIFAICLLACVCVEAQIMNLLGAMPFVKDAMNCVKKYKLGPNSLKDLMAGGSQDLNCGAGCLLDIFTKDKANKDKLSKMVSMLGSNAELAKPLLKCLDDAKGDDQCNKGAAFVNCAKGSVMSIAASAMMG